MKAVNIKIKTKNNSYSIDIDLITEQLIESFEAGSFSDMDWQLSGNANWTIDSDNPSNGLYRAKSGTIGNNTISSLEINVDVVEDGFISFNKKVSCEAPGSISGNYYDYLAFFIDNVEQAKWAGELDWSQSAFNISQGEHTLKWTFIKDQDTSDNVALNVREENEDEDYDEWFATYDWDYESSDTVEIGFDPDTGCDCDVYVYVEAEVYDGDGDYVTSMSDDGYIYGTDSDWWTEYFTADYTDYYDFEFRLYDSNGNFEDNFSLSLSLCLNSSKFSNLEIPLAFAHTRNIKGSSSISLLFISFGQFIDFNLLELITCISATYSHI